MTIVAGIDEAGYGPTLGPLVVCASAFRLEDGVPEARLDRLAGVRGETLRLTIADSKQLFTQGDSLARIEATTLGHALLARGRLPETIGALLDGALDFTPAELEGCPWYGTRGEALLGTLLPRAAERDEIAEWAERDARTLARRGITAVELLVAPVEVPRFNRLTTAAGSKAWPLACATGRLIETLVERHPDEALVIHVDRHGGRARYGELLASLFPMAPLSVCSERSDLSVYELSRPGRPPVRIDFHVRADGRRAPVALASVVAKTVREMFMECLNGWFLRRQPRLRRTAGYTTDARRFLDEVCTMLDGRPALRETLVRVR